MIGKIFKLFCCCMAIFSCGCAKKDPVPEMIHFAICADYPPFEYVSHGEFIGFEVDLARRIAMELGRVAIFHDMAFASIFPALKNGFADAAISAIAATRERQIAYTLTPTYFQERLFAVFDMSKRVDGKESLAGQKVACQLGSTMEIWVRQNVPEAKIITLDTSNQGIEMLKAGHVYAVILDGPQAKAFSAQNASLRYTHLADSAEGYAVAFPKGSRLARPVRALITRFVGDGTIDELKQKWGLNDPT